VKDENDATHGTTVIRDVYKLLVGKPEGKRPLGRPRITWQDINMDLKETGCKCADWTHLAQDRVQ
jgi:hypothetical protein